MPDPLFSAGYDRGWEVMFSSDAHDYGGRGLVKPWSTDGWIFPGRSAVLLKPAL